MRKLRVHIVHEGQIGIFKRAHSPGIPLGKKDISESHPKAFGNAAFGLRHCAYLSAKPTSPITAQSWPTGRLRSDEATAAISARSAAGSVSVIPPAILIYTS